LVSATAALRVNRQAAQEQREPRNQSRHPHPVAPSFAPRETNRRHSRLL
jgi:hypothetical protein